MNSFEKLEQAAAEKGLDVIDWNFESEQIQGLYYDKVIALNRNLTDSATKSCVLAEELGHYYTSAGDILDQTKTENRKQEYRARLYGYNLKLGLIGIIDAFKHGCRNRYEMAEYLEVTEEYLEDAIGCYRQKYGICTTVDNYVIYFIPALMVCKIIN